MKETECEGAIVFEINLSASLVLWMRLYTSWRQRVFQFQPKQLDSAIEISQKVVPLEVHRPGTLLENAPLIPFNERLVNVLCCPVTGRDLVHDKSRHALISKSAQLAFPINIAGVPILMKEWAVPLGAEE